MLVPYQRPTRHVPWGTYVLVFLNTIIFLVTVLVANYYLPVDRISGQKYVGELLSNREGLRSQLRLLIQNYAAETGQTVDLTDEQIDQILGQLDEAQRRQIATALALKQAHNTGGYQRF